MCVCFILPSVVSIGMLYFAVAQVRFCKVEFQEPVGEIQPVLGRPTYLLPVNTDSSGGLLVSHSTFITQVQCLGVSRRDLP